MTAFRVMAFDGVSLPIRAAADIRSPTTAAIAQPVEHIIRNDGVGGSNPSCGTTTFYHCFS